MNNPQVTTTRPFVSGPEEVQPTRLRTIITRATDIMPRLSDGSVRDREPCIAPASPPTGGCGLASGPIGDGFLIGRRLFRSTKRTTIYKQMTEPAMVTTSKKRNPQSNQSVRPFHQLTNSPNQVVAGIPQSREPLPDYLAILGFARVGRMASFRRHTIPGRRNGPQDWLAPWTGNCAERGEPPQGLGAYGFTEPATQIRNSYDP